MSIVIPRATWKPNYANGFAVIGIQEWLDAGKELWLHHTVTFAPGPDATLEQDCAHMRVVEQIGQTNFGRGISYTWVVMPSGRVFEGHSVDRQGSHTYQRNNRSRAICLAGNYDVNALPQRMQDSVATLLRELAATLDGGHRDVYETACPGQHAYARIPDMNNLAASGAPIGGGPGGGGGAGNGDEDMYLIKGDASDPIYVITITADGIQKKHVGSADELTLLQTLSGQGVRTVPQWMVDVPSAQSLVGAAVWNAEIPVEDSDNPSAFRPAHRVVASINEHVVNVIADVDEEALAEALEARGIDGANPAEVKAALADVLARTGLTVSPAPTGV